MLIALGISLLAHFLIVGGWGGSGVVRTAATVLAPLQARLEPMSAVVSPPEEDTSAIHDTHDIPLVTAPAPAAASRRVSPATKAAAAIEPSPADAAASGPGLRFYLARELDQYPSPLSALRLDNGRGAGSVRLWVSIDQTGRVVDAAVIDADSPSEFERQARERVLATPFVPARRDGHPVKSRILLVLGQGT